MTVINIVVLSAAFFVFLLERVPRLRRVPSGLFRADAGADVAFLVVGYLALAKVSLAYVAGGSAALRALGVPGAAELGAPLWVSTLLSLVLLDLGNYVAHLLLHRSVALWEVHKVHHSSPVLDWLATFRSHLVEQVLRRLLAPLLLIALGMPLTAVALAAAVFLGWSVLNHANVRIDLRYLEPLFITPRLHHLHHVAASSDRNLGTLFSIWDRLLGRLDTRDVPATTALGVPGEMDTYPRGFVRPLLEPVLRTLRRR